MSRKRAKLEGCILNRTSSRGGAPIGKHTPMLGRIGSGPGRMIKNEKGAGRRDILRETKLYIVHICGFSYLNIFHYHQDMIYQFKIKIIGLSKGGVSVECQISNVRFSDSNPYSCIKSKCLKSGQSTPITPN